MENKKNENLQSRRDFFRNAAKSVLPVLGLAVMSSVPGIVTAVEATGCGGSCQALCRNTCTLSCATNCHDGCKTSCGGGCRGGCRGNCYRGCYNTSR